MVDPRDADCHQSPGHTTKRSVWGWVRSVVALPHKYWGRGRGFSGKNFWSVGAIGQGCLGCGSTPRRKSGVWEHSDSLKGFDLRTTRVPVSASLSRG